MRLRAALVALLSTVAAVTGQHEEFDRLYAEAQAAASREDVGPEAVQAGYRAASDAFRRVALEAEGFDERLPAAGYAAYQARDYPLAVRWFELAIERTGPTAWLVEWRGWALLECGEARAALRAAREHAAAFEAAVDRFVGGDRGFGRPRLRDAAAAAMRRGDTELGLWYFRRVVETSGRHPVALGNLGLALRCAGRVDECERIYRESVERDPGDHLLWNDLGLFLKGQGRVDDAIDALRRSFEADEPPRGGPAVTSLAVLQLDGADVGLDDPAQAIADMLRAKPDAALGRRRCIDAILR